MSFAAAVTAARPLTPAMPPKTPQRSWAAALGVSAAPGENGKPSLPQGNGAAISLPDLQPSSSFGSIPDAAHSNGAFATPRSLLAGNHDAFLGNGTDAATSDGSVLTVETPERSEKSAADTPREDDAAAGNGGCAAAPAGQPDTVKCGKIALPDAIDAL